MVDNFHLLLKGQLGGVPAWSLELSASLNQTLRGGCVNEGFCYCYCLLCNICLLKRSGIGIANLVEGDVGQVVGQSSLSYVFEFASLIVISCLSIFFQFLLLFLLLLTFFLDFGLVSSLHFHPWNMKQSWLAGWLAGWLLFTFQRKWKGFSLSRESERSFHFPEKVKVQLFLCNLCQCLRPKVSNKCFKITTSLYRYEKQKYLFYRTWNIYFTEFCLKL